MPCCIALGCSTRQGSGKMMHRFPRDPQMRRKWEIKVRRADWSAHNNSFLCSDHFDESQYENHRADNLRKLKPNAVPTLFPHLKIPFKSQPPPCKRIAMEEGNSKKRIYVEHSYCNAGEAPSHPEEESSADDEKIIKEAERAKRARLKLKVKHAAVLKLESISEPEIEEEVEKDAEMGKFELPDLESSLATEIKEEYGDGNSVEIKEEPNDIKTEPLDDVHFGEKLPAAPVAKKSKSNFGELYYKSDCNLDEFSIT